MRIVFHTATLLASFCAAVAPPAPGAAPAPPAAQDTRSATDAAVKSILDELKRVPPTRRPLAGDPAAPPKLPAFAADVLDAYKAEGYTSLDELRRLHRSEREAFGDVFPLPAVVLDALSALEAGDKLVIRDTIKPPLTLTLKAELARAQAMAARSIFALEEMLPQMKQAAETVRTKERSKRWRAHFDLVEARLLARLAFLYEYSYLLGQLRRDALPDLPVGADAWLMAVREKLQVAEPRPKQYAKQAVAAWRAIEKNYLGTPWAFFAEHDRRQGLGLEWQPRKP